MERKPHSTGSIVGAVVLGILVLLGLYVGGYFALGEYAFEYEMPLADIRREYRYDWLAYGYRPIARVESAVTKRLVLVNGPTKSYTSDGREGEVIKDFAVDGT